PADPTQKVAIQSPGTAVVTQPAPGSGYIAPPALDVAVPQIPLKPSCETARVWKTEARSYCRSDGPEGCNRQTAKACVPMIDRRF
ncbi:MAG TPA: hypothetical protein VFV50_15915, partial [Bdellovibrionales bacterium]|nr:hypothetical protein [Bdellovibrionales bacterium]